MLHFLLQDEMEILRDMQVVDREVFYYLSQRTNHADGVIGKVCKVSYGGMAFDLSERVGAGRKSNLWVVSSRNVRNSVERLKSVGLLVSFSQQGKGNPLLLVRVFFAEYVKQNSSVKTEVSRGLAFRLSGDSEDISMNNNALDNKTGRGWQGKREEVSITLLQHQQQQSEIKNGAFVMTLDWQPTADDLNMILFRAFGNRYKMDDIDLAWVSEFVGYWYSQENRQHTQREWTVKLGAKVVDYFRRPELFDKLRGASGGSGKGAYVEGNSSRLPDWARPPKEDAALVGWMRKHEYGDAPSGFDFSQTRGWLRRQIDQRVADSNLPKISH